MTTQQQAPAIYKSMGKILKSITAIGKGSRNQQQGYAFRGIDDVMSELHGLFKEANVIVLPRVLKREVEERQTKAGSTLIYSTLTIEYRFTSCEDGSYCSAVVVGEAMDSGDKSTNKAMSAGLKYALTQTFLIPTKETAQDPDYDTHSVKPRTTTSVSGVVEKIESINSISELEAFWNSNKNLQNDKVFCLAISKRKNKINETTKL